MKKIVSLILIITCACVVHAQVNYVRNGSFEQYSQCPVYYDQVRFANYWNGIDSIHLQARCLPEYCNVCAPNPPGHCSVPHNSIFFQYPRSGKGMILAKFFYDESTGSSVKVDYLQGRLYKPLINGKLYCVTFYVNLAEATGYAHDNIGAYLDNGTIDNVDSINCARPQTAYTPQIKSTSIIIDTLNWVKIQGTITGSNLKKFITIGNFSDKANTNFLRPFPTSSVEYSYYLIDDVSVIESDADADAGPDKIMAVGDSVHIGTNEEGMPCTWYVAGNSTPIGYSGGIWVKPTETTTYVVEMDLCGHVTRDSVKVAVHPAGVASPGLSEGEEMLRIWPNPVGDELHIDGAAGSVVSVYDVVGGSALLTKTITSNEEVINISHLPKGIYIVHIIDAGSGMKSARKIVKQ